MDEKFSRSVILSDESGRLGDGRRSRRTSYIKNNLGLRFRIYENKNLIFAGGIC
jgi:hypothetical protein